MSVYTNVCRSNPKQVDYFFRGGITAGSHGTMLWLGVMIYTGHELYSDDGVLGIFAVGIQIK